MAFGVLLRSGGEERLRIGRRWLKDQVLPSRVRGRNHCRPERSAGGIDEGRPWIIGRRAKAQIRRRDYDFTGACAKSKDIVYAKGRVCGSPEAVLEGNATLWASFHAASCSFQMTTPWWLFRQQRW